MTGKGGAPRDARKGSRALEYPRVIASRRRGNLGGGDCFGMLCLAMTGKGGTLHNDKGGGASQ